ncbi:MAG: aminodeoxychorismate/anthranilate synthase component II [Hydrogenobacter thermophilus]|uniref:anthranilate synthase component II n=1 Tax=Hydrogenobacter thermophilus TaxID=940 RepID=UPI001C750AC6|nr:aminodeoxychorismate/anthranilate synthase component II [Hydrogenobacter thermophilus]QWK19482.1 MAG: aminodeoxychorismate/anthranilate synthase component II [Hydrogenobacter thermophilus]
MELLVIDNYDSFTYNLVQYFQMLGCHVAVRRNDEITLMDIEKAKPDAIVISPGPCSPKEAGISVDVIKRFYRDIPILGVCLGHQAIAYAFGAKIVRAKNLMHGKTSLIYHTQEGIFRGIKNPFVAVRYHSLVVERESLPPVLKITAESDDGEVMGLEHRDYPLFGVQFHPESVLSESGMDILKNFLEISQEIRLST